GGAGGRGGGRGGRPAAEPAPRPAGGGEGDGALQLEQRGLADQVREAGDLGAERPAAGAVGEMTRQGGLLELRELAVELEREPLPRPVARARPPPSGHQSL